MTSQIEIFHKKLGKLIIAAKEHLSLNEIIGVLEAEKFYFHMKAWEKVKILRGEKLT